MLRSSLRHVAVAIACLVISLIASAPLALGAERVKSVSSITVYDADDKKVGDIFSLGGEFSFQVVAFEVDGQPFLLNVSRFQFFTGGDGPFFQSNNCSGIPLIGGGGSLISPAIISAPGHTVYLADPEAIPQSIDLVGTQLGRDGTCQPFSSGGTFVSARAVVDLDTLFTPPFSVR